MVTFTPQSIMALLSIAMTQVSYRQYGEACKKRNYREVILERKTGEQCMSLNAATMHLLLTNVIGRYQQPLVMNLWPARQIWNYPVFAYETQVLREFSDPAEAQAVLIKGWAGQKPFYAPGTRKIIEVQTTIWYVNETQVSDNGWPIDPRFPNEFVGHMTIRYWLEQKMWRLRTAVAAAHAQRHARRWGQSMSYGSTSTTSATPSSRKRLAAYAAAATAVAGGVALSLHLRSKSDDADDLEDFDYRAAGYLVSDNWKPNVVHLDAPPPSKVDSESTGNPLAPEMSTLVEPPPPLPSRKDIISTLQGKPVTDSQGKTRQVQEFDLLVVGGGATGCGVALDAVTRGLKVALVERDDFSAGTSSRSTKLVHGGVRYLEKAFMELDYEQYKLVREALHERSVFLKIAPYLSYQLPIMLPLYKLWQLPYYWVGCKAYDILAGSQALESSYIMTKGKALDSFPMLRDENLKGALVYYDGQHNDSRMNVALALTAISHGAAVANHVEVVRLLKKKEPVPNAHMDANHPDVPTKEVLCGAVCRDVMTGEEFEVKAKGIINATGPFTDGIRQMDVPQAENIVAPSAGVHIILPGYYSPRNMGLIDPATSDGRVIFFLPWQGNVIAGTTDSPTTVTQNPVATEDEIQWILGEVKRYLSPDADLVEVKVRRGDVLAAWSGIRPLVRDPAASNTAALVRNHMIHVTPSGLLTIAGGKWTTYRAMAEETVDKAIEAFQLEPTNGCRTTKTLLIGSQNYSKTMFIKLIQHFGLETEVAEHLADSYGDRAWAVAAMARATGKRWPLFGKRLNYNYPYIEAEVRHAVRREYACTAVDVLGRRTRLAFLNAQAAAEALPRVINIMAAELNWDEQRRKEEYNVAMKFLATMGLPSSAAGTASGTGEHTLPSSTPVAGTSQGANAAAAVAAAIKPIDLEHTSRATIADYIALGYSRSMFTADELERYRAKFADFDKDNDGSIPRSSLLSLLRELGILNATSSALTIRGSLSSSSSSHGKSQSFWSWGSPQPADGAQHPDGGVAAPASPTEETLLLNAVYANTGVDRKLGIEFNDFLEVVVAIKEYRASAKLQSELQKTQSQYPYLQGLSTPVSTERSGGGV
ncbi:mitochondrial glycerol-3-phosphate dehydrogenase [Sorochytrium milnesiophthora]